MWNQDKIDRLSKELDALQGRLVLRVLISLNSNSELQATAFQKHFKNLDKRNQEIVEVMSINQNMLHSTLGNLHEQDSMVAKARHDETIAAILTTRDGDTRYLTRQPHQSAAIERIRNDRPNKTFITFRGGSGLAEDDPGTIEVETKNLASVHRRVLNSLYLRQIAERIDDVSPRWQKTFEWVFRGSESENKPWGDMVKWLERGTGCYWVNGKAGAGKSTFLKFLREDIRTDQALSYWAGDDRHVLASFFFWNLGSNLQKSQLGLLRALLYEILKTEPDLTACLLPSLYQAAVTGKEDHLTDPSHAEVKKAFHRLISQPNIGVKICLFVDGIDEYEGDRAELAEMLNSIPYGSCVKSLISSRPIPACVEIFSDCPSLKLQALTHDDIKLYVHSRISEHPRFKQFVAMDGPQATQLVEDIVEKASGVFLWVIIVVRRLLDGLRNFDRLSDLKSRLDGLPRDLEELYNHMLSKLDPLYQQQASKILQLVFRSITLASEGSLKTMLLAHADDDDPQNAIFHSISVLTSEQRYQKCLAMEGRIRSRCCGLVEIQQDLTWASEETMIESRVVFLHRTVVEFLLTPNIWNGLLALTADLGFDTNVTLLGACLLEVKTNEPGKAVDVSGNPIWRSMRACLQYARLAETTSGRSQTAYLDELDRVMSYHWSTIERWYDEDPEICFSPLGSSQPHDWACSRLKSIEGLGDTPEYSDIETTVYSLAAGSGLLLYLREKWMHDTSSITAAQARQIVIAAVSCYARNFKEKTSPPSRDSLSKFVQDDGTVPSENCVKIIDFLLQQRAHTRDGVKGKSKIWLLALHRTYRLDDYSQDFWSISVEDEIVLWTKMLEQILLSGADPNTRIDIGERPGGHQQSALLVISRLFSQLPFRTITPPAVLAAQDRIQGLLKTRGALEREWLNGRLIKGLPEGQQTFFPPTRSSLVDGTESRKGFVKGLRGRVKIFTKSRLSN